MMGELWQLCLSQTPLLYSTFQLTNQVSSVFPLRHRRLRQHTRVTNGWRRLTIWIFFIAALTLVLFYVLLCCEGVLSCFVFFFVLTGAPFPECPPQRVGLKTIRTTTDIYWGRPPRGGSSSNSIELPSRFFFFLTCSTRPQVWFITASAETFETLSRVNIKMLHLLKVAVNEGFIYIICKLDVSSFSFI